jgi:uncharacterized RDD family membrane protein YckC
MSPAPGDENPYKAPTSDLIDTQRLSKRRQPAGIGSATGRRPPAVSTSHTILRRHLAAAADNLLVLIVAIASAKAVGNDRPLVQGIVFLIAYVGYYFISEGAFQRTPGKFLTGLVVLGYDGARVTWRQTLIRTAFRFLEVNPILLGQIPAALSIVFSRYHQRFGDRVAGTIVVPVRHVKALRAAT